jgi:Helix-turn-helix domain
MSPIVPDLLLPDDAARLLFLSTRKILALARTGKITHVLIDGDIYFTADDIAEFIRARRIPAQENKGANNAP